MQMSQIYQILKYVLENSEPQEPFNETEGEQQSVIETETSGNANMNGFQKNWNTLVQNSQQTFKKWQDDWDTYVKQNQEKMQTRNAKMRDPVGRKQSES